MLVKYVSFLVFLLITVSCASSRDDGEDVAVWDPQHFKDDVIEAIKVLGIVENSNLPPYLKMLEFLSDNSSSLAHHFGNFIVQNYFKPSDLLNEHQTIFWRSLIFSSVTDYSKRFPQNSCEILQKLQLLPSPSLDKVQSLFDDGLLDNQFSSYHHFHLVSGWGHASTVKLLLNHRTDISAYHAGWALFDASGSGHNIIVELLLNHRTDISADHAGWALMKASDWGHTTIAELLLQSRKDISADHIGSSLEYASDNGYTTIVELLLQSRNDISARHVGAALRYASKFGYTAIAKLLLQSRNDISADNSGWALFDASRSGHATIVELILQSQNDISAFHLGASLEYASGSGHTSIVELLRQYQSNMNF